MRYKLSSIINKYAREKSIVDYSLALLLASLPLPFAFINIAFVIFIISVFYNFRTLRFNKNYILLLPVAYYILCMLSLIWTMNINATSKYLSKGIFFLLVPLIFLFIPKINGERKNKIFNMYSYLITIQAVFYLLKASYKYFVTKNIDSFFYHELVTLEVNAIYVSLFVALAFIHLLLKESKKKIDYLSILILLVILVLLSSKNIILITLIFCAVIAFIFYKTIKFKKIAGFLLLGLIIITPISYKIIDRFQEEIKDTKRNTILNNNTINVSVYNAWNQNSFTPNHFFNGTSFRIFQMRIFKEIMTENNTYLFGFGASGEQETISNKLIDYDLHENYWNLNFHNQYIQSFASLGIFGILTLILMNGINLLKSIRTRDILYIFFSVISISIMFSESLFERQRGIVFYVVLFCLFNSMNQKRATHK